MSALAERRSSLTTAHAPPPTSLSEEATARLAQDMGLLPVEYAALRVGLGRLPAHAELAVVAGMWSEHCSYKSTRHLLATLPRQSPAVLAGPGQHAGVVSVGEGWAVAFKIESHNHPSAVEPYQGAATGVGGILRDVIAAGARPCALLDFLCFGDPGSADTRRIVQGVVRGISDYGNAMGVPNVGGRTVFDPGYEGNPLVNVLCAGLLRPDAIRHARVAGAGHVLLLVGARTGRDGVLGAAFASEALGDSGSHAGRRSHIQVGDPFAGKLLMEAVLAFGPDQGLLAVQDLGACGLACATFEMAAAGGVGFDVDLDAVPTREPGLSPIEIFLSETQERFALVVQAEVVPQALAHFFDRGVTAAAIGRSTEDGVVRVRQRGVPLIELPAALVAGGAPDSQWPLAEAATAPLPATALVARPAVVGHSPADWLLALLEKTGDPEPIYSRFDQTVGNRTVRGPGQAAAAVLRLPESLRGFALSLTGDGLLCAADPYLGAQSALAEAVRRLGAVGAELLAITDGLNHASPRDPGQHRQLVEVVRGLRDGLLALGVPVTGGNVSLYNQSPRGAVPPTPMIGGIGIVPDVRRVPGSQLRTGQVLYLVGELADAAGASRFAALQYGQPLGTPRVDLAAERRVAALLIAAVAAGLLPTCKVVSRGGLLTALARLALASGVGLDVALPASAAPLWQGFGEHPAQVLVSPQDDGAAAQLGMLCAEHGVPLLRLGICQGSTLRVGGLLQIDLATLAAAQRQRAVLS